MSFSDDFDDGHTTVADREPLTPPPMDWTERTDRWDGLSDGAIRRVCNDTEPTQILRTVKP